MGNRYIITGTQIGIILTAIEQADGESIKKVIEDVQYLQQIGHSHNDLKEDIKKLKEVM